MSAPTVYDGTEVIDRWIMNDGNVDSVEGETVNVPRLRCECLATIEWEDLARGYCSCSRPLHVVIGSLNFGHGHAG